MKVRDESFHFVWEKILHLIVMNVLRQLLKMLIELQQFPKLV